MASLDLRVGRNWSHCQCDQLPMDLLFACNPSDMITELMGGLWSTCLSSLRPRYMFPSFSFSPINVSCRPLMRREHNDENGIT